MITIANNWFQAQIARAMGNEYCYQGNYYVPDSGSAGGYLILEGCPQVVSQTVINGEDVYTGTLDNVTVTPQSSGITWKQAGITKLDIPGGKEPKKNYLLIALMVAVAATIIYLIFKHK